MAERSVDRRQSLMIAGLFGFAVAMTAFVVAIAIRPAAPPVPVVIANAPAPAAAPQPEAVEIGPDGVEYFGGWQRDDAAIAVNLDPVRTLQFAATPAGKVVQGDEDVFLWRAVRQAAGKTDPWYPNIDQGKTGSCVGAGNKHGVDVAQAVQIVSGKRAEFKPVSAEAIYAFSRVEIGGGKIRGDGSVGAWAAKALQQYGVLAMEVHGRYDLSAYSAQRAREWGRSGVPDELQPTAAKHVVKSVALVTTWADVKRSISQGYPVVVCSNVGFAGMVRDRDGFIAPRGVWNHCMVLIGVRVGDREGAFCLNSWNDKAHTGPVWPADAPVAGFWIDAAVVERMVRQGDSFALSDVVGFPARTLPEFLIHARPAVPHFVVRSNARDEARAEHPLAW